MKKVFVFILVFICSIVLLSPKKFLWEKVNEQLHVYNIKIKNSNVNEDFINLNIENPKLYWNNIEVLSSQNLEANVFFIYNKIILRQNTFPFLKKLSIPSLEATLTLFDPLHVKIFAPLQEGKLEGFLHVLEKKGEVVFVENETKSIPDFVKRFFKKTDEGYRYAISF
jgi:hypothetical protein